MATFTDLYMGDCEKCGADLTDWSWLEDDMIFHTNCDGCGSEYTLEPTIGILTCETIEEEDEDDKNDEDE
jgi:hypothetical protein